METELIALKKEVSDLRSQHDEELAMLKRDLDLRNANTVAQYEKRLEEMERSVDERAMDRVDAVTKKTITVNNRQRIEIENLHKEVRSSHPGRISPALPGRPGPCYPRQLSRAYAPACLQPHK
jgi:hypothetical protein